MHNIEEIKAMLCKSADELERISDTHGLSRVNHIIVLAKYLSAIGEAVAKLAKELEEENEDTGNEV